MGKLNMDKMKSKLENVSKNSGGYNADYDKLVDGKNIRRILWPKGDSEEFWEEGYVHFNVGPEGKSVCTCAKTFSPKAKCPVCEYVEELQKSKNKDDKKLADDLKAKKRIYVNVINRDSDDEEDTPKVLAIGVTILKALLEAVCDPDYGDITDYDEGRDVTIKRSGKGLQTEYSVLMKPKTSVASEQLSQDELEEKMTDLKSLFVEKSYDELKAVLEGEEPDDDDDEESGEDELDYDEMDIDELEQLCKSRKIKLPAKPTRIKLITLLEKSDEDEEEAEEEEEEKPVRSSKTPKKSEEEPDDDDDDEESGEDDSDDIQDEIAKALAERKKKK